MKKIIVVNASPRINMNTAKLVREAANGALSTGAQVKIYDLYQLESFTGCISCFGCKLEKNLGKCICKDGLTSLLEDIRDADGLIIGTPNYLGDVSAAFRSLYERLIFQSITYKKEIKNYNTHFMPVLFIMTSNVSESMYSKLGYDLVIEKYKNNFNRILGNTKIMICGDTLQVHNYDLYNWSNFDVEAKKEYHEKQFPNELKKAYLLGEEMVNKGW